MCQITLQDLIQLLTSFTRPENRNERSQLRKALHIFGTKIKDEDVLQHQILSALVIPRVASDLHIFELLIKNELPVSTTDLAAQSKASEQLLARTLRYLASQKYISSPSADMWEASELTPFLANRAFAAGLRFGTACIMPSAGALPALLAHNVFQDMSKLEKTAFQIGNSTSESMYEWLVSHPDVQADFQTWMAESQKQHGPVSTILPLDEFIQGPTQTSTALFVDVGGGNGHVCAQIRLEYPHWKGRIINQDLQARLIRIDTSQDTIEHYDHDFFEEQPVKAAKIYHLRNILHNWSDEKCIEVLSQTCRAMDSQSVMIIDSSAMPDADASWHDCYVDIVMGMFFGSRGRTLNEYRNIVEMAGLVWVKSQKYKNSSQYVMVLKRG
ncbi:S-adenosyl-L-methionine-dependent methyltransferase [Xylaria venustula]|nr:S-adenosyl-L-methionine-dependent methyltransferase [Xylaria venustula]